MPVPQMSQMHELVRNQFVSHKLKIPPDWQPPSPGSLLELHYKKFAFKPEELLTIPGLPGKPNLFSASTANHYHTEAQKFLISKYDDFMNHTTTQLCDVWDKWQKSATITNVVVNGPVATGGQLVGPPMLPMLMAKVPLQRMMAKYYTVATTVLSTAWMAFQSSVKIPALPLYPQLAMFPGPSVPPFANTVQVPVGQLAHMPNFLSKYVTQKAMVSMLDHKEAEYKERIQRALGNAKSKVMGRMPSLPGVNGTWLDTPPMPTGPFAGELFDSISHAFENCFNQWKSSTLVSKLMVTGPVPSFAPPATPAGPIVGGLANMIPGGLT